MASLQVVSGSSKQDASLNVLTSLLNGVERASYNMTLMSGLGSDDPCALSDGSGGAAAAASAPAEEMGTGQGIEDEPLDGITAALRATTTEVLASTPSTLTRAERTWRCASIDVTGAGATLASAGKPSPVTPGRISRRASAGSPPCAPGSRSRTNPRCSSSRTREGSRHRFRPRLARARIRAGFTRRRSGGGRWGPGVLAGCRV